VVGPEHIGEIRVDESCEQLECLVIDQPDKVLELYERNLLQEVVINDYLEIKEMIE